jgi:hypothetical protein
MAAEKLAENVDLLDLLSIGGRLKTTLTSPMLYGVFKMSQRITMTSV